MNNFLFCIFFLFLNHERNQEREIRGQYRNKKKKEIYVSRWNNVHKSEKIDFLSCIFFSVKLSTIHIFIIKIYNFLLNNFFLPALPPSISSRSIYAGKFYIFLEVAICCLCVDLISIMIFNGNLTPYFTGSSPSFTVCSINEKKIAKMFLGSKILIFISFCFLI